MASNTDPTRGRGVLAVAVTALLVASAVAAGVSLTAVGTASAAPEQISDCTTIGEPGVYELAGNVTDDGDGTCIEITSSDVTFDGNGYAVVAGGVVADGSDGLTNVTVRDVRVLRGDEYSNPDVRFENVSDGRIAGVDPGLSLGGNPPTLVGVAGDNNTITSLVGPAAIAVTGDGNRIVDTRAIGLGAEYGVSIDGDDNVVENVTAIGLPGLVVSGADNRVANGSFDGQLGEPSARLENATGTVFVENTIDDNDYGGLVLTDTTDSTITDNVISAGSSVASGLVFENSDNNTIATNQIYSIGVDGESASNLIYNNRIGSVSFSAAPQSNTWNVSERPGENIVGGDTLGGNYYAGETCEDANSDGFCDSPNQLGENNTDYLPLVRDDNASTSSPNFEITSFDVPPQFDEGEEATVSVTVTNTGSEADTQTITLRGDFVGEDELGLRESIDRTVPLDAGETTTLTFNVTYDSDENDDTLVVESEDTSIRTSVTLVDTEETNYQVDFVIGQPIENLSADNLYAQEDRLLRFAFGDDEAGITDRGSAWPSAEVRDCVDYRHVRELDNGTASVRFRVTGGCEGVTLSLVTYSMPGEEFSMETVDQQELLNSTTGTYGLGGHTITVDLPDEDGDD